MLSDPEKNCESESDEIFYPDPALEKKTATDPTGIHPCLYAKSTYPDLIFTLTFIGESNMCCLVRDLQIVFGYLSLL